MKLGEIKLEALRMMRAEKPSELFLENLEFLSESESCMEYLLGMTGAINRAFVDIEAKGVLAEKRRVLLEGVECSEREGKRIRFELPALIEDYDELTRVIAESEEEYNGNYPFIREGETILLVIPSECKSISVMYSPKIARVFSHTDNKLEINIPEEVASLIPYFIKSELYSEDEPDEAAAAREYYEKAILTLIKPREGSQGKAISVYSYEEV